MLLLCTSLFRESISLSEQAATACCIVQRAHVQCDMITKSAFRQVLCPWNRRFCSGECPRVLTCPFCFLHALPKAHRGKLAIHAELVSSRISAEFCFLDPASDVCQDLWSLQSSCGGAGGTRANAGTSTSCSGARCCASGGGGDPGGRATRTLRSPSTSCGKATTAGARPVGEAPDVSPQNGSRSYAPDASPQNGSRSDLPHESSQTGSRSNAIAEGTHVQATAGLLEGRRAPCRALSCPNLEPRGSRRSLEQDPSRHMPGWAWRSKTSPLSLPHPSKTW